MATITRKLAVERLRHAVGEARPDDLAEIHNELFPAEPANEKEAKEHRAEIVKKILAHFKGGLEVEEILDLWNVTFPVHHRSWFDEDADLIHYDEAIEPVYQDE